MQRDLYPGSADNGAPRAVRPLAGTLFGVLALVQLLCLEGHINTPDGQVMFNVNRAILERGSVAIAPLPGYNFGWRAVETDAGRHLYSKFGLGTSLISLPFMALGEVLLPLAREGEKGLFADYQLRIDALNAARAPAVPYARKLWYDPTAANFREALLAYRGPQLHLFAGMDGLVPAEAASDLLTLLPDVEIGLIEQAGHAFLLEDPHGVAGAIQAFLHECVDD